MSLSTASSSSSSSSCFLKRQSIVLCQFLSAIFVKSHAFRCIPLRAANFLHNTNSHLKSKPTAFTDVIQSLFLLLFFLWVIFSFLRLTNSKFTAFATLKYPSGILKDLRKNKQILSWLHLCCNPSVFKRRPVQ